jgi:hypothetical protein
VIDKSREYMGSFLFMIDEARNAMDEQDRRMRQLAEGPIVEEPAKHQQIEEPFDEQIIAAGKVEVDGGARLALPMTYQIVVEEIDGNCAGTEFPATPSCLGALARTNERLSLMKSQLDVQAFDEAFDADFNEDFDEDFDEDFFDGTVTL